jgi:aminoglycoside phosphotransferase (APT) family kinase protein
MSAGATSVQIQIDVALVRRLLEQQFPAWADASLEPVASAGTDNALFRLSEDKVVRLPKVGWAIQQVAKECEWLPKLAPHLPLSIPQPLAMGNPTADYPWRWAIYTWLAGETATPEGLVDLSATATALADFVRSLHAVDPSGGPPAGAHNLFRGVPLAMRAPFVREALSRLGGILDTESTAAAWETDLSAPAWNGPATWVHGDIHAGNLLMQRGRLTAVIDFGALGLGDPACDLAVAWNLLAGEARRGYREALAPDDATWKRGRGWALSVALIALPYYLNSNPAIAANARYTIAQVLEDHAAGRG